MWKYCASDLNGRSTEWLTWKVSFSLSTQRQAVRCSKFHVTATCVHVFAFIELQKEINLRIKIKVSGHFSLRTRLSPVKWSQIYVNFRLLTGAHWFSPGIHNWIPRRIPLDSRWVPVRLPSGSRRASVRLLPGSIRAPDRLPSGLHRVPVEFLSGSYWITAGFWLGSPEFRIKWWSVHTAIKWKIFHDHLP